MRKEIIKDTEIKENNNGGLTKKQLEFIKQLGDTQLTLANETGLVDGFVHFLSEEDEMIILNPFADESGSFDVNPIECYGESFLKSNFVEIAKRIIKD